MKGPNKLVARAAALVSAAVLTTMAVVAVGTPAHAAGGLGTLTLTPNHGTVTDNPMLSATTSAPCPTGYGTDATLKVGKPGAYNNLVRVQSDGGYDLAPVTIAANRSFDTAMLITPPALPAAGTYQVIIICTSETLGDNPDVFSTDITIDAAGNWAAAGAVTAAPTATVLGVSPASPAAVGDSVTLTATVTPAAAGSVEFFRGASSIGTAPIAAGVATLTTTTLPAGTYALTAKFTSSDPAFAGSTSDPTNYTVNQAAGSITANEVISADVAPGAFSLTVAGNAVALTGGTVGGTATGQLQAATVTDLRGTNSGWTVVGQVTDFSGPAGTIAGFNLGWTPSASKVSGSGAVVAGPVAAPGAATGLDTARGLCSAANGSSAGVFTCGSALKLNIPDTTKPGSYAATLTLTLA